MQFNIAVIYGSVRSSRVGIRGALFIQRSLEQKGHQVQLVDAAKYDLPLLDKMFKEYDPEHAPAGMKEIAGILSWADGFVIVSGEYNHSVPPALKNLLDHYQGEYHFKPSAIATYSVGPFGGVRTAPHIRTITGELGMPSIPIMFAMSAVGKSFDENGKALDPSYEKRIQRFISEFEWYLAAFKNQRELGTPY